MKKIFPLILALAIFIAACAPAASPSPATATPPLTSVATEAPAATETFAPLPTATATESIPQGTDFDATVFNAEDGSGFLLISGDDRLFIASEQRMRDGVAIEGTKIIGSRFNGVWYFWLPQRLPNFRTTVGAGINDGVYVSWTTGSTPIERQYSFDHLKEAYDSGSPILSVEENARLGDITAAIESRLLCYPTTEDNVGLDFGLATWCPPQPATPTP